MKKLILKSTLFLLVMLGILFISDSLFLYRKTGMIGGINSFNQAPEQTVDVLLLGNSHMAWGIDPILVEAKTGLRTEAIVGAGLEIAQVYYNALESIKTQQPAVVVVETYPLLMRNSINDKIHSEWMLNVLGTAPLLNYNAFTYHNFALERRGGDLYDKFYIFRYHDDWTDLESLVDGLKSKPESGVKSDLQRMQKSSYFIPENQLTDFRNKQFPYDDMYLNEQEKRFIDKLIALSVSEDFKLIFFTVPVLDEYYQQTKQGFDRVNSELAELISEAPGVTHFDYNGVVGGLDYTYLKNEWGITHSQHLNYKGVTKASNALGDYVLGLVGDHEGRKTTEITRELVVYHPEKFEDELLAGELTRIQFHRSFGLKNTDTIQIPNRIRNILVEGWMYKTDIPNSTSEKIVALKKDSNFIFISTTEVSDRDTPDLVKKFSAAYAGSGYTFKVDRRNLEPGVYQIYHILKTASGDFYMSDMKKWIQID